ncbi:RecQ family ATP-dependent DNA helicase [Pseudoflavitalea sp. X16]|uniref:RecQ family ATP-dependent DNA helicase n=1 Tax=Paraflavitalea devenefica TaxID=2716334 RepID=UPI0014235153|nr:RecQ family ATP-dependent DNA helicase [Paraflavitalea devenefica]NII25900.1 RecQ family ATP-dependent DNA helicase [Paraflavitalea devenefica]
MTRKDAEIQLNHLFGFSQFHDLQWTVIQQLLAGKKVLFIEKTGFGKSLCYQFPATQLQGITIVFSPLIALMRDQVRSMHQKGIRAAAINSNQTDEENDAIIEQARNNELDILYIAPERMENAEWIGAAHNMKIAMVVIDEAHCISMWGQSFRPNYRRIVNLVNLLPKNFPVLATTATATVRVQDDIVEQVGAGLIPIRGQLLRSNISLSVITVQSEDEKFYWLAENFAKLSGTGIIYTGTQANTDIYANWLQFLGFNSTAYSGRLDAETRKRVEEAFISNQYDAVVSTNALGMGIDKPDIRFIIHTQVPQSPIHYYQEIGRAGRDGQPAEAILLYHPSADLALPRNFIEGTKPAIEKYQLVIDTTKVSLKGRNQIIKDTNLKQKQVEIILADLVDQKILHEMQNGSKKYAYNPEAPVFDPAGFELLRVAQQKELEQMVAYIGIDSCRMHYLCDYLGDKLENSCGICDNDKGEKRIITETTKLKEQLQEFRETFFPVLDVEAKKSNIINGVAASYYGVSNVGAALHHSKYDGGGDFPDWLVKLTLKAFRKHYGKETFDLILYVPPTESGDLVKNFAGKIGSVLKISVSHKLVKTSPTDPQKRFESGISKKDNVHGKFAYVDPAEIAGKKILLIDDIFDSGYTVKEIGQYLTNKGASVIAPLVIARTVGGDI